MRLTAVLLLVVTAGLFTIGTTIEKNRDDRHDEPRAAAELNGPHDEANESSDERQAASVEKHDDERSAGEAESDEAKILGVNRESTALVVLAVLASLALAALVWQRPGRPVWIAAAVIAATFAVFDVAEVAHQLDESATGLALLAAIVAVGHLVITGIAAREGITTRA